ncbi:hypothetical protein V6N13_025568 [Hibiscus sabdariffa]
MALIIAVSNTWNSSLVQSLFDSTLAIRICCIPLAKSKPPNELVWRFDNTGIYSPKSGYKLLIEEEVHRRSSLIGARKLQVRNICPLCDAAADSIEHFTIHCFWSQHVLELLNLSLPSTFHNLDYKDAVVQHFMNIEEKRKMKLVLTYWESGMQGTSSSMKVLLCRLTGNHYEGPAGNL